MQLLTRLAEGQIHTELSEQGMVAVLKGENPVITQPGWSSPDDYVTMNNRHTLSLIRPIQPAKLKYRRDSKGHGNNGSGIVRLVLVLMQGEPAPGW